MSEPETIEEYIESLRPLVVDHLEWMAAHIDKERYPERNAYKRMVVESYYKILTIEQEFTTRMIAFQN